MGNGVHFVFFIDFVLLKGAEWKTIDWFFKGCAQTHPQAHPQILHRKINKFSKLLEVWNQWKENLILTKKHVKTKPSNWFLLKIWLIIDFDVSWNIIFIVQIEKVRYGIMVSFYWNKWQELFLVYFWGLIPNMLVIRADFLGKCPYLAIKITWLSKLKVIKIKI